MTAGVNSISAETLELHWSQRSYHHLTVCSLNDRQGGRERDRERGGVMTVLGCIGQARLAGGCGGLWLMPESDRMGLSVPLPLKIIESAALNTKLQHALTFHGQTLQCTQSCHSK